MALAAVSETSAHTVSGESHPAAPVPEPTQPQPSPASVAAPEPSDPDDLIADLEAQVTAAEARAKEADDEALQRNPEANDLRARLARGAAKKKLGPTG